MFRRFSLALIVGLFLADGSLAQTDTDDSDMIVGGVAAKLNGWPWQVRLFEGPQDAKGFCGGTLIDERWVLTAAHCFEDFVGRQIGYGHIELAQLRRLDIAEVVPHKEYNDNTKANDIALVKLAAPVKFDHTVAELDLAPSGLYSRITGARGWVTGWGSLFDYWKFREKYPDRPVMPEELTPPILQEVDVVFQDLQVCRDNYGAESAMVPDGQVCAGYVKGGKDSCQGDSGGPLVVEDPADPGHYLLAGVVSWGLGCAEPKLFGVYTRPDYYFRWMLEQVRETN